MNIDAVEIPAETIHKLKNHAVLAYPNECCGILSGKREDDGLVRVKDALTVGNRISDEMRGKHFAIDPMEIYKHEKDLENSGLEIIGFFHSHPNAPAVLSREDEEGMIPHLLYVLLSVADDTHAVKGSVRITAWCKENDIIREIGLKNRIRGDKA